MIKTLIIDGKPTNKDQIIKQINQYRLDNKNHWYQFNINYGGVTFKGKCYNTWVQILYCYDNLTGGLKYKDSSPMELNVRQFNSYLNNAIK